MPFVAVDSNVSLPATLVSTGLMRKFWMPLVFGAASYQIDGARSRSSTGLAPVQNRESVGAIVGAF